jgi:hypothetical protein
MSDPTDLATEREEEERQRFLAYQLRVSRAAASGQAVFCVNGCGEKPAAGSRFCGSECCADFSERKERQKRLGVR